MSVSAGARGVAAAAGASGGGGRTMFCSRIVWLRIGRLWVREQRSPCRHAPILR